MQLEVRRLAKAYRGGRGLKPLSLGVERGEFLAVVGHNGAGKSTLLKLLASWLRPDDGEVWIDGVPLARRTQLVRRIGFVPETPNLYESFTVDYNLRLFARLFGLPASRVEAVAREFELERYRRTKVQALSKGLRQRVSLARCLLADPDVLLFDEPTSGLDFEMTRELYRLLESLHAAGKTILFSSHRPEEVQRFATRMIVLHGGELLFDGSPGDYFASKAHQDLYV